ncbi:type IV secretory system conjugative DNA transfer family protein [Nocardiopsis sp. NPDC055879]
MARKTKKTASTTPAPGSASLPPEVLAALGQPAREEPRTLKSEGVGAIIAAGWKAVFRPGEHSIRRHMAAQFYPFKVGATVLAAGVVAARAAEVSGTHAILLALATGAGSWAALRILGTTKARKHRATKLASEWAEIDPAHARVCSWAAGLWLVALILIQPATLAAWWWSGLVGLLALLALGSRFWAHHRVPRVLARVEEHAPPPPPPGEHPMARKWRTQVASGQGPLPGTKLTDLDEQPYGLRGRLHLVPGRQTINSVRAALGYVATGLGVDEADILVEHVEPTEDEPKPDSSVLDIKLVTVGLLNKKVPLEAGRLDINDDGEVQIRLGPYADGDGQARYRLYTADSMWGGFVAGSTGSGKSGLIDNLALGAWETKNTIVIYLDPKNGGSSPRIFDRAHWAIPNDPDTWDRLLSGLVELVEARGLENSARLKTSGFTPTAARPGVLVIVDECHAVITSDNAYRVGRIAREGRAAGVAMVLASQIYGLDSFGGSDAVRANVTAGNTVALRVSRNQASMIADITLDPSALPKITGVGLTAEGRDVAFRAAWAPNDTTAELMDAALEGAPTELDPLAAGALDAGSGGLYSRRHEIAAQQVIDAEARLAAYEAGHTPTAREATAPQVALSNIVNPSLENMPTSIDPALLTDTDLGLGILAAAGRDPNETLLARWSGAAKRVLELLIEHGKLRRGEIEKQVMEAEQCSRATVGRAMDDLAEASAIEALANRGGWQLAV